MTKLFDRRYKLTIDGASGQKGVEITDLDIGFRISKSTKKQPNKCEIQVYNLSPDTRGKIEGRRDRLGKLSNPVRCDLEAGYADGMSLVFSGDLHTIYTDRQGPDWVTHLASADGLTATRQANVSFSVKRGTGVVDTLKKLGREFVKTGSVKIGNLDKVVGSAKIEGMGSTFPEGTVIDGPAYDELCRLAESAGFEVSIQHGALQVKERGKAVAEKAIDLSADSGLLGSPKVEANQDPGKTKASDRFVTVETLMIPGIFPGRKINLDPEDKAFRATYECIVDECEGETFGEAWGHKLKLRPV